MSALHRDPRAAAVTSLRTPRLPAWLATLFETRPESHATVATACGDLHVRRAGDLLLLELCVPEIDARSDEAFRALVKNIYAALLAELCARDVCPLRFWNYVPSISRPCSDGGTRYERFSAGRFAAYRDWYNRAPFDKHLKPASAVDHRGCDFVVHVLAGRNAGAAVENPRQRPAYRYSRRYGPFPPSFARALRLPAGWAGGGWAGGGWAGGGWAGRGWSGGGWPGGTIHHDRVLGIVAGTASIVGEDSRHLGDVSAQLEEIFANLAELVRCMQAQEPTAGSVAHACAEDPLAAYRDLRVYLVRESDVDVVRTLLDARFPSLAHREIVAADLCRPELLIEIEGVLELPSTAAPVTDRTEARHDT
jgi:chorismate lyase/3-hydroxybenzoate synthase